jgi:hypothetical protein
VFAACRTENALCEAGVSTLADIRNLNTTITAIRFISNPNHPIRHFCLNPLTVTWTNIDHNRFDYELCAIRRSASNDSTQTETFRILNEKYEHYSKIYTDGSKKDEKVGYAVVISENTIIRRQFPQNSIYSAEQSAIIKAIYSTAN